jgi:hypothetical protein
VHSDFSWWVAPDPEHFILSLLGGIAAVLEFPLNQVTAVPSPPRPVDPVLEAA